MPIDKRATRPLLATLLMPMLLGGSVAVAGEIYTWKDSKGVVHYSDVKPESNDVKVLKAGTQRDTSDPAPAPAKKDSVAVDPDAAFRKRQAEAAEADKKSQQAAALKENCDAARNQLTALRSGERMARYNAAGEKEVLDDSAREAEIARVQRTVDSSCK